jgi:GTP-binding protein Era
VRDDLPDTGAPEHRSGFACFVGRPNVGKSTLLNAIVGSKIAITSPKPQTTRRAVRGIVTRPDGQLVIVDTPGLHKPRTLLGERLDDLVRSVWSDVDVVGLCIPADQTIGPGDRRIAADLSERIGRTPVIGIVTKTDAVSRERVAEQLAAVAELRSFADIVPVSAVSGEQVDLLTDLLVRQLPPGPALYPDGEVTDEPIVTRIAELVREAALDGVRDELPHSLAAVVTEMAPREGRDDLTDVYVTIYVERDSQ